jgi:formylglycine-generating enzyme required for sulfatase activity
MAAKRTPVAPSKGPSQAALEDFSAFAKLGPAERKALAESIATELGPDFRAGDALVGEAALATVVHLPSSLELVLIPGGVFEMGFTEADQKAFDRFFPAAEHPGLQKALKRTVPLMTPSRHVRVRPFALARRPLENDKELVLFTGATHGEDFSREEAEAVIATWGFRLPSEAECEYVAREGKQLAFSLDVAQEHFEGTDARDETAWGIVSPAQTVWVGDRWHRGYKNAPADSVAWTAGRGKPMHRGSFSLGLSAMQSADELVFALTALRQEPLGADDENEVRLRFALGPDETGRWRLARSRAKPKPASSRPLPTPVTPPSLAPPSAPPSPIAPPPPVAPPAPDAPRGERDTLVTYRIGDDERTAPLWRAADELAATHQDDDDEGQQDKVLALLSPAAAVRARVENALVDGNRYPWPEPTWPQLTEAGAENSTWARATLDRLEAEFPARELRSMLAYALVYPIAVAGLPVEPKWTTHLSLVAPPASIVVWEAIPAPAREAAMVAAIERVLRTTAVLNDTLFFLKRYPRPALAEACLAYFTSKEGAKKHGLKTMRAWVSLLRPVCAEKETLRGVLAKFPAAQR